MKLSLALFLALVFSGTCYSQEPIMRVNNPVEVRSEVGAKTPKELEGLQWNRWTSQNFVVCSLNDQQAQYLHKHLELVKGWIFARWGLPDVKFSAECKLICVDDKVLFKKLFNLESTRVEIRRDADGKIKESVIFILLNGVPSQTVPIPLTEVCLAEFAQRYGTAIPIWGIRGMSLLNGSIDQIRDRILEVDPVLQKNDPVFFSKGLMEITKEQYMQMAEDKRRLYDNCALIFCLMVRKEFGQDCFLRVLKGSSQGSPENALKAVVGFKNYMHFDRSLKRYLVDVTREVKNKSVPDGYLQITEKK